jgi:hypothetical protein
MVLQLAFNDLLRLTGARGAAIEVLDGSVWITENGASGDQFLSAGRRYRVRGAGLVVVGAEGRGAPARVEVRTASRWRLGWPGCGEPRIAALSDHLLRDIGLRRDQVR